VIEFAALLLMSTLFGGMALYSFGLAPMAFNALPPPEAGRFIRAAFPWYYLFVIVTAALSGLLLLASNWRSGALALAIGLIGVYARQGLMPHINAARDAQLKGEAGAKARFGRLHALSVGLNFIQMIAAGWILHRFLDS
jgi:hypothetical protein